MITVNYCGKKTKLENFHQCSATQRDAERDEREMQRERETEQWRDGEGEIESETWREGDQPSNIVIYISTAHMVGTPTSSFSCLPLSVLLSIGLRPAVPPQQTPCWVSSTHPPYLLSNVHLVPLVVAMLAVYQCALSCDCWLLYGLCCYGRSFMVLHFYRSPL